MKKKNVLCNLLISLLFLSVFLPKIEAQTIWDGSADSTWFDDASSSYDITSPEELAGLAQLVNHGHDFNGVEINLQNDLWLNANGSTTNNWTMIGGHQTASTMSVIANVFKGTFHGNGHTIYNMYCNRTNGSGGYYFQAGLFGAIQYPCTIDSLIMVNPITRAMGGSQGALAAIVADGGDITISKVLIINANINQNHAASDWDTESSNGCIIGNINSNNSHLNNFINCGATGSVYGYYVGGLTGGAGNSSSTTSETAGGHFTNCYFKGTVSNQNYWGGGGIASHGGVATNCYSSVTTGGYGRLNGSSFSNINLANPAAALGDAFRADCYDQINNGYPIMAWQPCNDPLCAPLTNLEVSNIHGASATLTWTPGTIGTPMEYTVEYMEAGGSWNVITGVTGSPYVLGGLNPRTAYTVRVKTVCDDYSESEYDTVSFETVCLVGGDLALGTETGTTENMPANNYYNYSLCEELFTTADLGGANTFRGISFQCVNAYATSRNWAIYLMPTTTSALSTTYENLDSATAVKVFDGNVSINSNWFDITFDTAFSYDGTTNLLMVIDDNTGSYVSSKNLYYKTALATGKSLYIKSDGTNYNPFDAASLSFSNSGNRTNVIFHGDCDSTNTCAAPQLTLSNTTSDGVTVTFVAGYQESAWNLEYKTIDDTVWTSYGSVSGSPVAVTGLNANTQYYIRLQADCGGGQYSEWTTSNVFRTQCGAVTTLPYNQGFESDYYSTDLQNYILCWNRLHSDVSHYAYVASNSSNAYAGSRYLDFHYTPGCYVIAIAPELDASIDMTTLMAQFWLKRTGNTSTVFEVGVMTDPEDATTFEVIDTVAAPTVDTYEMQTVAFSSYTGTGHYVAFRASNGNSAGFLLDDLTIDVAPQCSPVTDVEVGESTATTTAISWTQGALGTIADYSVRYSEAGQENWTVINSIDTTYYLLNNLEPATYYDVQVQSNCDNSAHGEWVSAQFRTECLAGGDVAIGEGTGTSYYIPVNNFYRYTYSQQIFTANEMGGANTINGVSFQYAASSASTSKTNVSIYMGHTTKSAFSGTSDYVATSDLHLVYTGALNCSQGWNRFTFDSAFVYNGTDNLVLAIDDNSNAYNGSSYTFNKHNAGSNRTLYYYNDSNNPDMDNLSSFSGSKSTSSDRNNVIFHGECDTTITCVAPHITLSNVTSEEVTVSWLPGYLESVWNLEYKASDDSVWTAYGSVNASPFVLNGLNANTEYQVRMQSDCGAGDVSAWATTEAFRTECAPISVLPFTEDFEDGIMSTSQGNFIYCWNRLNSSSSHYAYIDNNSSSSLNGSHYLDFHYTPDCYVIAIAPELDASLDLTTLMADFWLKRTNNTSTLFEVGVMTNPSDATTFVPVDTIEAPTVGNSLEYAVGFSNYTGTGHYIAFRASNGSSAGFLMDDLTIDVAPLCSSIHDITVGTPTGTSVALEWTPGVFGTVTDYTLRYSEAEQNNWTNITGITTTSYLLNNLEPGTYYDVQVKVNCDNTQESDWVATQFHTACLVGGETAIGNGTEQSFKIPVHNYKNYSISEQIFTAAELNGSNHFNGIAFQYATDNAMAFKTDVEIYLGHTSKSSFASTTDYISADSMQLVYSGPLNCIQGWNKFDFDDVFTYNGTDNLVLAIDDNSGDYDNDGYKFNVHSTTDNMSLFYYSGSQNPDLHNLSAFTSNKEIATLRNNVIFYGDCDTTSTCAAPYVTVGTVTATTATINWVAGYQETAWQLEYKREIDTAWTSQGTVTSMSETISGLASNTAYNARLRSVCSATETSTWTTVSFTTECGTITAASLPMFENFDVNYTDEDSRYVTCWSRYASDQSRKVYLYNFSGVHSAPYCLDFNWTPNCYNIAILPEIDATLNLSDLMASFYIERSGSSVILEIGVMTDKDDPTTFTALDTIIPAGIDQWEYVNFPFTNYTGTGKFIAFKSGYGSNCGYRIDDLTLDYTPSCMHPSNLEVISTTTSTIELGWNELGTATAWNIEYGPTGFTHGNGTVVAANTNPFTVTNLEDTIEYDFYVQADCGSGDVSDWFGPATSYPGVYNMPASGNDTVQMCGGIIYDNGGADGNYSNSCNGRVVVNPTSNTELVSISGSLTAESSTWDYLIIYDGDGTTELYHSSQSSGNTVTFGPIVSTTGPLTVYFHSDGSGNYAGFALAVSCVAAPTCLKPVSLTASGVTTTTVNLAWTEMGTATAWNIEYGPAGFTQGTGTTVAATSNPFTLTGLTAATTYNVYVQADCGSGDLSEWSNAATFTTECDVVTTYPYTQGFENGGSMAVCWNNSYVSGSTNWTARAGTQSGNVESAHTGSYNAYFYNTSGNTTKLVSPIFDLTQVTNPYVSYWYSQEAWGSDQDELKVYYRASSTDAWTLLTSHTNDVDTWTFDSLALPSPSATYQIAFEGMGDYGYGITLDDITVDGQGVTPPAITCDAPTNVAASNLAQTTATITWTAGGTETAWNLQYKAASATDWSASIAVNNTPTYALTGLTSSTAYDVRVQAACDAEHTSDWATATFTTLAEEPQECPAPTNFRATEITKNSVTLAWEQPEGTATEWEINYKLATADTWTNITVTTNPYTITDLTPETAYSAQILAHCTNGVNSDASETITFTTLVDGINDYILDNSTVLYPNPTTGLVTIRNEECGMRNVKVYDVYGKLIANVNANGNVVTVDATSFAAGIYFAQIETEKGVVTKRFVKK